MKFFKNMSRDCALIMIVIAIALLLRIASFAYLSSLAAANPSAYPYPVIAGDSIHYSNWANTLLTRHIYQEEMQTTPKRGAPPGYSALLAFIKAMTGSMTPIVLLQTFFTCISLALIYKMARTLLPPYFAIVPAFLFAIDPMVVLSDTVIMTDSIFCSLIVCIIYLIFFYVPSTRETTKDPLRTRGAMIFARIRNLARASMTGMKKWFFIGLLLGIATMIRPIGEFFVIVLPAFYLFRTWMDGRHTQGPRVTLRSAAALFSLFIVGFGLIVVPWMIRNEIDFGSFEISNIGTHNLLDNDVRGFLAWRALAQEGTPMPVILVMRHVNDPIFTVINQKIATDLAQMTPPGGDVLNYEGRLSMRYILSDPIGYAYFHIANTIPFFLSSSIASYGQIVRQLRDNAAFFDPVMLSVVKGLGQLRHPSSVRTFFAALGSVAPIGLEVCGWFVATVFALIALVLRRKESTVLLCAILVLYFAGLTGPMSDSRYRIPAEPYFFMLAVVGVYFVINRIRRGRTPTQEPVAPSSIA